MPRLRSGPFEAELFTKLYFTPYVLHQRVYYVNTGTVRFTLCVNQYSWSAELILPIFEISRQYYLVCVCVCVCAWEGGGHMLCRH